MFLLLIQTSLKDVNYHHFNNHTKTMFIGLWALLLLVAVIFHRQIIRLIWERSRLIWYISKMPGPFSIPLLGTTWQVSSFVLSYT